MKFAKAKERTAEVSNWVRIMTEQLGTPPDPCIIPIITTRYVHGVISNTEMKSALTDSACD